MAAKTLDRSRKFGVLYGAHDGSAYTQDGLHFDGEGLQIGTAQPETIPDKPGPNEVELGSDDDLRSQLESLHPSQIKKLVEQEGLVVVKGPGSKAKNIENLLAAG